MIKQGFIAVVEDDQWVRDTLKQILSTCGYEIQTFENAQTFLASLRRRKPDCLISDIQMPGLDGIELQGKLKAMGHRIPTILMSGLDEYFFGDRLRDIEYVAFVPKPCDLKLMLAAIQRCLRPNIPIHGTPGYQSAFAA